MLNPGTTLQGRYTIETVVGEGAMGRVYRAQDERLGRRVVAIKEMTLEGAEREAAVRQFHREASLVADLRHPGLVAVEDWFEEAGRHYLVMEFIEGSTLEHLVSGGPLPIDRALRWIDQICGVLEYLHGRPHAVLLRDLKPANVMIDHAERVRIIDFGIARVLEPGSRTTTLIRGVGTPGYAPLEQYGADGSATDVRSDQYAAGATAYCLLTGGPPPECVLRVMAGAPLVPASQQNADLPAGVDAVLDRMLACMRDQRFASIGEARAALRAAVPSMQWDAASAPSDAASVSGAAPTSVATPTSGAASTGAAPAADSAPATVPLGRNASAGIPAHVVIPSPAPPRPVDISDATRIWEPPVPLHVEPSTDHWRAHAVARAAHNASSERARRRLWGQALQTDPHHEEALRELAKSYGVSLELDAMVRTARGVSAAPRLRENLETLAAAVTARLLEHRVVDPTLLAAAARHRVGADPVIEEQIVTALRFGAPIAFIHRVDEPAGATHTVGIHLPRGWACEAFVPDDDHEVVTLQDPHVLICREPITEVREAAAIRQLHGRLSSLLVVTRLLSRECTRALQPVPDGLLVVTTPHVDDLLEDVASVTGGRVVARPSAAARTDLGRADDIECGRRRTLIAGGAGGPHAVEARLHGMAAGPRRDALRLGVTVLNVLRDRRRLGEAVRVVEAAREGHAVVANGSAAVYAWKALPAIAQLSGLYDSAAQKLLSAALLAELRAACARHGIDADATADGIAQDDRQRLGLSRETGAVDDLIARGEVEPADDLQRRIAAAAWLGGMACGAG